MAVTSPVRHPWVDAKTGRLSFPLLEHWGSYGTRLAAVVQEALKGLGGEPTPAPSAAAAQGVQAAGAPGRPPQPQQPPAAAGGRPGAGLAAAGGGSGSSPSPPRRQGSPMRLQLPPQPSSFPQLQPLTNAELSEALCDETAYRRLVDSVCRSINLSQVRPWST